jgi:adenylate kinase
MRLVLVGPPGAGKSTQAQRLAERLNVPHISTGDLFRSNLRDQTPLGVEAKRFMDAGDLVPDKVTVGMVSDRLDKPDSAVGFILVGFPRTVSQAKALAGLLQNNDSELDAVVELTLPDDTVLIRYADLCRARHKSAYAESRIMPRSASLPWPAGVPGPACAA